MDNCFDDDSFEPLSSTSTRSAGDNEVKAAVHQLLEDGWFFGKLLDFNSKPRMLRCYSDPSPSFDQQVLANTCPPSGKSSSTRELLPPGNLTRAPSLPPNIGRSEERIQETESNTSASGMSRKLTWQLSDQVLIRKPSCAKKKEGISQVKVASHANRNRRSKMMAEGQSSHHSLIRTPSLPPYIGREEMNEESESDEITMSELIRQAMPLSTDILPRQRSSKDIASETSRFPKNQGRLEKSLSNLESHEVQGVNDKKGLNPLSMVEVFAGLQEKRTYIKRNQDKEREPYPSSSWQVNNCARAPPILVWASKDSAQDIKAQLKFWARSVASNVR
ncbi:PREDICTED: uncharacterized protein LOC105135620 isoform X2 [Populus euphratica]|uniref:Uncharacterized protein LOC105135620 isoform X2 n=1 Tax=Populus euphratica TaxID=75702 RepID=A0AAJ6Y1G6_POPEU|nr:PREDICTED: uncharacterized protein LOC105135620 isoform X2 [Populus euphratica]